MMHEIPIVSCGPLAQIDDFRGVVHAAFQSSLYLAPPQGPMMVIHDVSHGHTPTSLLVQDTRALDWSFRFGDPVTGRAGRLLVKDRLFDARHASRWQSPPPPSPSPTFATRPGACASRWWQSSAPTAVLSEAEARVGPSCRQLTTALAAANEARVANALRALIGAGPGLTPSGDDVVVGLLTVLHRASATAPVAIPLGMLRRHLRGLLHRTTPLSAHYLKLAMQGHLGEHLTALIDSCLTAGPEDARQRLADRVLRTGATSGADSLVAVGIGLSFIDLLRQTHRSGPSQVTRSAA